MITRIPKTSTDSSGVLYERHADMCKVFSNAVRLRILSVIGKREMSVAAIAKNLGVALGTVSPHLLMMKQRRVLGSRKKGNQVFYRLANPKILRAFDLIREILSEQMREEGQMGRELQQAISRKRGRRRHES
jgi:ArsR family transcriptional regulator